MSDWYLPPTPFTPEVLLSPAQRRLSLKGESCPENALSFYAPLLERMRALLEDGGLPALQVEMHISSCNSASAKALYRFFQLLNRAAERGCAVRLTWSFDEEDALARDLGNTIREDFPAIAFEERPVSAA